MAQLADVTAGVADDGVHVEGGAADAAQEDALATLVEAEGDLTVVVLATDVDEQELAGDLLDERGGTIVVLDPAQAALADARLTEAQVQEALERAGADAASADPVVAATALADAADAVAAGEGGVPWLPLLGGAVVVVLVVAVLGRAAEGRRRRRRDAAAIASLRGALQDRVQEVADLVLELEPAIPLAGDEAVRAAYADASAAYRRVSDAYPTADNRAALQRLTDELEVARATLLNLKARTG